MRRLRDMRAPYQHAREVSIVRSDTCTHRQPRWPARIRSSDFVCA
jgi:hypothetical protein